MTEAAAVYVDPATLTPWSQNPRNNEEAIAKVARSIERFGFASPIVARTADGRIIAGHTRHAAAMSLGLRDVPVRFLDIDEQKASALALADNRLGEIATWDDEGLSAILEGLAAEDVDLDGLGWDESSLDELLGESSEDERYTAKIEAPIYEIKGERPDESELYDQARSGAMVEQIQSADIDEEARAFLLAAATRHTVFRYDKIAEYYAHASADVQRLMEDSALVIIDFDKAIELGFVQMSKTIAQAYELDHEG
jgi:ParB-like chromosome segregation protein Spo0J